MPRGGRRQVAAEDDDSDHGNGPEVPMSPNTKKEYDKKIIMAEDLGRATANLIKTSDYNRSRTSNVPLIRQCDIPNTEQAKVVKEKKAQISLWTKWGQTEEARQTASGDPLMANMNGNTHRHNTRAALEAEGSRLGRPITLDDTYDDRPYRGPVQKFGGSAHGKGFGPPSQAPSRKVSSTSSAPTSKNSPKKRRGGTVQERPWPPAALQGTPVIMNAPGPAMPRKAGKDPKPATGNDVNSRNSVNPQTGSSNVAARKTTTSVAAASNTTARPRPGIAGLPLADPSTFMSSVTQLISSASKAKAQVQAPVDLPTSAVVEQAPPPPSAGLTDNSVDVVRKVPVTDFSFPLSSALAPGNVSTHTDGAPSPAALSGFSPSAVSQAPAPQVAEVDALADALVGLGIQGAHLEKPSSVDDQYLKSTSPVDATSQSGSLMDSPVPEDVAADVLVANKDKNVVVINGVRYVLESELLALKGSMEKPQGAAHTGPQLTASPLVATTNTLPTPSNEETDVESLCTVSGIPSNSVTKPAGKVNPFSPREPVTEDIKIQTLTNPHSATQPFEAPIQARPRTLDEALVAAVREATANPVSSVAQPATQASTVPNANKTTAKGGAIVSKWANQDETAGPPVLQPARRSDTGSNGTKTIAAGKTIVSKWALPVESAKPPILQPKSTNGTGAHNVKGTPTVKPAGLPQAAAPAAAASQTATGSIIGDRHTFGRFSSYAASAPSYAEPPIRQAPKRKFHEPGPGFAILVADLAAASTSGANETKPEEEL